MVVDWFLGWNYLAVPVDFCWLAVDPLSVLGLWLALAVVVLDSNYLVYSLARHCLVVVAGLVVLVDLDLVDLPVGFLAILVDNYLQGSSGLVLAQEIEVRPRLISSSIGAILLL